MNSVIHLHRPARKPPNPPLIIEEQSEEDTAKQLATYALAFTGCALMMYTAAIVAVWDSWSETLSVLWLVFALALIKLVLANGVVMLVLRSDRKELAELAARERSARGFSRWRGNIRLRRSWREPRTPARSPMLKLVPPIGRRTPGTTSNEDPCSDA